MSADELNKKLKVLYLGCGKTDFVFESANALDKLVTEKRINHLYTVNRRRTHLAQLAQLPQRVRIDVVQEVAARHRRNVASPS